MPFDLPPQTPWYIVIAVFALYGFWKLIEPYARGKVRDRARENSAETDARISKVELEQKRQALDYEQQRALLANMTNLTDKVGRLAEAVIEGSNTHSKERRGFITAIRRNTEATSALQTSVDALPERIAEKLSTKEKEL